MDNRPIQPPLPTKTPPPGKVCIVFFCIGSDGRGKCNVHYKLCVVDLNSDIGADVGCAGDNDNGVVYTPISPTLQIDTGCCVSVVRHAFCVFNQTQLYVFEGFDVGAYSSVETGDQKSIFTYDLQTLINNNYDSATKTKTMIHLRNLTKVGDMLGKKVQPSAVPTPDGNKILLLDTELNNDMHNKIPGDVFELFDPLTLLSEHLPPIPNLTRPSASNPRPSKMHVALHGFVSMSRFVVDVPSVGTYVIDLEDKERGWERISCPFFGRGKQVFAIEDRFLFTTYGVHDISYDDDDVIKCFDIPSSFVESSYPWYDHDNRVYGVDDLTLLKHDKDKGECYFYVMHSEGRTMHSDYKKKIVYPYCNLSIDVCRAFYPKKGEDEKPVEMELKSSRAFKLSSEPGDYEICVVYPCFLSAI